VGGIKSNEKQLTQFLTIAQGTADLEQGSYEISLTWDDAGRVYIHDKLIVDEWNPSKYKFDESPNKKVEIVFVKGTHKFRLSHVELGGFASLRLQLKKVN